MTQEEQELLSRIVGEVSHLNSLCVKLYFMAMSSRVGDWREWEEERKQASDMILKSFDNIQEIYKFIQTADISND